MTHPQAMVFTSLRAFAVRWLAAAMATAVLASCSSYSATEPAPSKISAAPQRYRIGPSDTLNVLVWRNPELSTTVMVRPDGYISTPLVDDLQAAGRSPVDVAHDIEKALSRYVRDPVVSVTVPGFQGDISDQVRIVGEAAKPQSVPYRQNMTVLDAILQAGGMTEFADGNKTVLIRSSQGDKRYSVRLKDLMQRGDLSANVPVMPGDIILVPSGFF
jgi:polysaccharide export outer membrane protein